ncbi:hypothetical protein BNJ_00367 [Kaumoebavirus]|uniref:hypothetical protein n=1 Tax=Kaumoebavirus TaxID=1859492 RepID=UPI0009C2C4AD|nr:hypothetical protein BNJ_00367 [Kaumoebavirus]ARA72187.1 hypothetical protein BNJ_00367 [Kaumoebavirus]
MLAVIEAFYKGIPLMKEQYVDTVWYKCLAAAFDELHGTLNLPYVSMLVYQLRQDVDESHPAYKLLAIIPKEQTEGLDTSELLDEYNCVHIVIKNLLRSLYLAIIGKSPIMLRYYVDHLKINTLWEKPASEVEKLKSYIRLLIGMNESGIKDPQLLDKIRADL